MQQCPVHWSRVTQSLHRRICASRKVFQLPTLPQHQPQLQSWQKPPTPTLNIRYPPGPAQASHQHDHQVHTRQLAEGKEPQASRKPMAVAAGSGALDGAAAETLEAQEVTEPEFVTSAQEALLQDHPAADTEEGQAVAAAAGVAAGGAASPEAAGSGTGLVEEAHYGSATGLKPSPVARALAGPTVHMLLEGYVSCSAWHLHLDHTLHPVCRACVFLWLGEIGCGPMEASG